MSQRAFRLAVIGAALVNLIAGVLVYWDSKSNGAIRARSYVVVVLFGALQYAALETEAYRWALPISVFGLLLFAGSDVWSRIQHRMIDRDQDSGPFPS